MASSDEGGGDYESLAVGRCVRCRVLCFDHESNMPTHGTSRLGQPVFRWVWQAGILYGEKLFCPECARKTMPELELARQLAAGAIDPAVIATMDFDDAIVIHVLKRIAECIKK